MKVKKSDKFNWFGRTKIICFGTISFNNFIYCDWKSFFRWPILELKKEKNPVGYWISIGLYCLVAFYFLIKSIGPNK